MNLQTEVWQRTSKVSLSSNRTPTEIEDEPFVRKHLRCDTRRPLKRFGELMPRRFFASRSALRTIVRTPKMRCRTHSCEPMFTCTILTVAPVSDMAHADRD